MNLQLNPSQILSLYELLVSSLTSNMDLETSTRLKEIKQKFDALIMQSLDEKHSSENKAKFSAWSSRENEKIVSLKNDLQNLKIFEINKPSSPIIEVQHYAQKEI